MTDNPDMLRSTAKAKGRRPYFFADPAVDKLLAMTMAIAGELAVTRERLDTVERILAEKGQLSAAEIDAWRPDEQAKQERAALRQDYIARVLMILHNELAELEQQKAAADYEALQRDLAEKL
jgi:primosomal protein N''